MEAATFEGLILSELSKEDLHRPLRAREVLGAVLFILSFGVPGAIILAIHAPWLRWVATAGWVVAIPFYTRAVVRRWRASREAPSGRRHAT